MTVSADPLAIASFNASLPTLWIGQITYLNVTVSGGAPPYSYWYAGLPWSCHSLNNSSLRCFVAEAQHFTITVTVNDTTGASVRASIPLIVSTGYGGPPKINYFYPQPSTAALNTVVHILANATSVSSTPTVQLKFTYLDLPHGCASFNQTDLQCIPDTPGTYHLMVQVTDGFSALASSWTWLNVTGSTASNSTMSLQLPGGMWLGVGIVLFLVLIGAILLLPRRRKSAPSAPVEPWKS